MPRSRRAPLRFAPALAWTFLLLWPAWAIAETAPDDDSVARLLERNAAALGSEAAWDALVGLEIRGTLGANGRENQVRLLLHRDGRIRYERRYRDMLRVFVDDGERGHLLDWRHDEFVPVAPAMREQIRQGIDLIAPLPEATARYWRTETLTDTDAPGDGLVTVRLTPSQGLPLDLSIDPQTARSERATYRYVDPEDGETYTMNVFLLEDLEVATPAGSVRISAYQERDEGTSVTVWVVESARALSEVDERELEPAP